MSSGSLSRRLFLQGSSSIAGSTFLRAGLPALIAAGQAACSARDAGAAFEKITAAEAREFEAIAARIIPTTDTPGAREAGVVYFFDKAFGDFAKDQLEDTRRRLAEFQAGVPDAFPGAALFSDLDEADQDAYLEAQEDTRFFSIMRLGTIMGMFALSSWGGNRDDIGWKLIGMGGPPQPWQSPFGHYDREYLEGQQDGE